MRAFARSNLRQTCPSTAQGHRKLIAWLRKHKVNKAVMEASGGYERDWARVLREAGIEVRIVDPKRVRSFALSAGRLAKNDAIDAEMIAWFAETFSEAPGQTHDAAHEELQALVKARKGLIDLRMRLESQSEQPRRDGSKSACPHLEEPGQPKLPGSRLQSPPKSNPRRILPSAPRSSRVCRASPRRAPQTSLQGCRNSDR